MITIKSPGEIDAMRRAGSIVGGVLKFLRGQIRPGCTTLELDSMAEAYIRDQGAKPAFKGYHGFPATICTSVNEEVVHGIPSERILKEGDIVGIDVGAIVDGYYGDAARTFAVGAVNEEKKKLMRVADEALQSGAAVALAGNRISDISYAVQMAIEPHGFGIVREYVGHGIGSALHEDPQVPNFGKPHEGPEIQVGMALAIEPMVNAGTHKVDLMKDGWTVKTQDRRPSAHFENTILITRNGNETLTREVSL